MFIWPEMKRLGSRRRWSEDYVAIFDIDQNFPLRRVEDRCG